MDNIHHTQVSARELEPILRDLERVLEGRKVTHCAIALIMMTFMVQDPKIETDVMVAGVKQVTEMIALHISAKDDKGVTH